MANKLAKGHVKWYDQIIDSRAVPVIKSVGCPYCEAPVGLPCHSKNGKTCTACHVGRNEAYATMLQEVKETVEELIESGDLRAIRSLLRP